MARDQTPWLPRVLDNFAYVLGCPCGLITALVLISITGTALGWWP